MPITYIVIALILVGFIGIVSYTLYQRLTWIKLHLQPGTTNPDVYEWRLDNGVVLGEINTREGMQLDKVLQPAPLRRQAMILAHYLGYFCWPTRSGWQIHVLMNRRDCNHFQNEFIRELESKARQPV